MDLLAQQKASSLPVSEPDAQADSALFKLPPEIRSLVWTHALTAYDDKSRPYQYEGSHHWRPKHTCARVYDTALLSTCRAIYLEARHLPLSVNTAYVWCYRGPDVHQAPSARAVASFLQEDADLDEDDTPRHFERFRRNPLIPSHFIRSAHFFTQQYFLECDNFYFATMAPEMAHVEHLTVTLRGSDWWNYRESQPLGIDPRLPAAVTSSRMLRAWDADVRGESISHHPEAWGSNIRNLPKLQTFTVEMEVDETREAALGDLAEHARQYWTFLHHGGDIMKAAGPPLVTKWTGPACLGVANRKSVKDVCIATYTLRFV